MRDKVDVLGENGEGVLEVGPVSCNVGESVLRRSETSMIRED